MKLLTGIVTAMAILLIPTPAAAQDGGPYISGIYYQCQIPGQDRADQIVRDVIGPVYDQHVAAGRINAWGWLGHRSGGAWRRAGYFVAPTLDGLMDGREAIIEELMANHADAMNELNTICPTHDDYIWQGVSTRTAEVAVQERPAAGHSTYFVCDVSRQSEADSVMNASLGPILDRHMEAGNIRSWSWWSHVLGGKYRRLLVLDGASHKANMNGLLGFIADAQAEQPAAFRRLSEICSSHQDYLWNILIAKP
jgi:hypothetical protein